MNKEPITLYGAPLSLYTGKARSYLETVISLRPTPEAYQEYGRLLNRLGEGDAAADAFREGLGLVAEPTKTAIPHLKTAR